MKESDCLPCPCCGGHAQIKPGKQYRMMIQDWHSPDEERYQPCSVQCRDCGLKITRESCNADNGGAEGAARDARRKAVEAWNSRTGVIAEPRKGD